MNPRKTNKVIVILTVLCSLATIVSLSFHFILPLFLSLKFNTDIRDANSIGIIGGADGPTTIYLSNSNSSYLTVIFAVLSIVGIVYLTINRRKKDDKGIDH